MQRPWLCVWRGDESLERFFGAAVFFFVIRANLLTFGSRGG